MTITHQAAGTTAAAKGAEHYVDLINPIPIDLVGLVPIDRAATRRAVANLISAHSVRGRLPSRVAIKDLVNLLSASPRSELTTEELRQ